MAKKRLTSAQIDVLEGMTRYKKELVYRFPLRMGKGHFELDGKKVNENTVNALKNMGLVEHKRISGVGLTTHHYGLTELGKKYSSVYK